MCYRGRIQEDHRAQPLFYSSQNCPTVLPKTQALQYGMPSGDLTPVLTIKELLKNIYSNHTQCIFLEKSL